MAQTSLLLTYSSSLSPAGGGGGGGGCCPCFGGMVNRKERATQTDYRLVKTKRKTKGESTHSLKRLTPLLRVFYLRYRWQSVAV
jgi:hypothetical protein